MRPKCKKCVSWSRIACKQGKALTAGLGNTTRSLDCFSPKCLSPCVRHYRVTNWQLLLMGLPAYRKVLHLDPLKPPSPRYTGRPTASGKTESRFGSLEPRTTVGRRQTLSRQRTGKLLSERAQAAIRSNSEGFCWHSATMLGPPLIFSERLQKQPKSLFLKGMGQQRHNTQRKTKGLHHL